VTPAERVVVFGDTAGLPRVLGLIDPGLVSAIVRAEIRPEQADELAGLAAESGLELLVQPRHDSGDADAFVSRLRELAPDLVLTDSYSMRLPDAVLELPRLGAFNVHGALLPEYRGPNPIQWALLSDERETGVTIHRMTSQFDAGEVIAQRRVPIRIGDTWVDVYERLGEASGAALADVLPAILAGTAAGEPQDESRARHNRRRTREDGAIDWDRSVLHIHNLIRALVSPHPGAFYVSGDDEVVLDSYMTIPEVAALKFGPVGAHELSGDGVILRPVPGDAPSNDRLRFEGDAGCSLEIDWDSRSATIAADSDQAARLVRRFAGEELELEVAG
jgi:methionyl-tRNA formyltransferase